MISFASKPPFEPKSDKEVVAELCRDLPDRVKMSIDASRWYDDRLKVWVTVFGNFSQEAIKFACLNNPNLSLDYEKESSIFLRLTLWCDPGRPKAIE